MKVKLDQKNPLSLKAILSSNGKNLAEVNNADLSITLSLKPSITPLELAFIFKKDLSRFSAVEVDLDSFVALKLKHIRDEHLSWIIHSFIETLSRPFLTCSNKKSRPKWIVKESSSFDSTIAICEVGAFVRKLQEMPSNLLDSDKFVEIVSEFLKGLDIEVKVIGADEVSAKGMNLHYAVGKETSKLMVLSYKGGCGEVHAVVGKGILFDTGGLNLKTGAYMTGMKFDMSGAAVTVGLISLLARLGSKSHVVGVVGLAENLVGSNRYRPDDVLQSYHGLSVEIDNTDAEGRLVLADGIHFAHADLGAKSITTIATLTGAIGHALGDKYAGVWTNSEERWESFKHSSDLVGEGCWRMPLDSYFLKPLLKTRVADLKNSSRGLGSSCRAASFLYEFAPEGIPFMHLDIANVSHDEYEHNSNAPLLKTLLHYFLEQR